ncbi:hypothetical protein [Nannocystis punicea]|uniref:Uncharacterized protein n=1 Tax=Nannocystis punicea TaxID=2995304 RepID=A0ABY7HEJ9_9BACT|nr:hypothetical protein [Nannocystis poenicansa]WAS97708.1 hypothetical protein O0S08_16310 [Nannocystis poenicansa]
MRMARWWCWMMVTLHSCGPSPADTTTDGPGPGTTGTTGTAGPVTTTASPTTSTTSSTGTSLDVTTTATTDDATSTTSSAETTGTTSTSTSTTSTTSTTDEPALCFDTDETTGEARETTGDETGGEPVVCPPRADQPCTAPVECTPEMFCGSHVSSLDEHGCPRLGCLDDADCGPDEKCWSANADGAPICVEKDGACECSVDPFVSSKRCLPKTFGDIPALCPTLTNEADCNVFRVPKWLDYCEWTAIEQFCPGTCGSRTVHRCVNFSYHGDGCLMASACPERGQLGFFREGPLGPELLIAQKCEDDPPGWAQCGVEDDPGVCDCRCTLF